MPKSEVDGFSSSSEDEIRPASFPHFGKMIALRQLRPNCDIVRLWDEREHREQAEREEAELAELARAATPPTPAVEPAGNTPVVPLRVISEPVGAIGDEVREAAPENRPPEPREWPTEPKHEEPNQAAATGREHRPTPSGTRYKRNGAYFGDLEPVRSDPDLDPPPYACFLCWGLDHGRKECNARPQLCCLNCGRWGTRVASCPRCRNGWFDRSQERNTPGTREWALVREERKLLFRIKEEDQRRSLAKQESAAREVVAKARDLGAKRRHSLTTDRLAKSVPMDVAVTGVSLPLPIATTPSPLASTSNVTAVEVVEMPVVPRQSGNPPREVDPEAYIRLAEALSRMTPEALATWRECQGMARLHFK